MRRGSRPTENVETEETLGYILAGMADGYAQEKRTDGLDELVNPAVLICTYCTSKGAPNRGSDLML